jgi:hypothetical protein
MRVVEETKGKKQAFIFQMHEGEGGFSLEHSANDI